MIIISKRHLPRPHLLIKYTYLMVTMAKILKKMITSKRDIRIMRMKIHNKSFN